MDSRHEATGSRCLEYSPRLRHAESASIAEDVAKLRKTRCRNRRNPSVYEKIDECIRAFTKFGRHNVGTQECLDDVEWLILMQLLNRAEDLELVWPVQAIAALCFDCCR